MSTDPFAQLPQVREFFESIEPMLPAYPHRMLSFVALVHDGDTVIVRARLLLTVERPGTLKPSVRTANLRAAQVPLPGSPEDAEVWARLAVSDQRLPPVGEYQLRLLPAPGRGYSANCQHPLPSHSQPARFTHRLVLEGRSRWELFSPRHRELERELRDVTYDTLDELMHDYGLDGSHETAFEIAAEPVAGIAASTRLRSRTAQIDVRLARRLPPDRFKLTVRNAESSGEPFRHSIEGSTLRWSELEDYQTTEITVDLPCNAIVDCRAVYAGHVQAEVRLADPEALPNRRRMMLEVVDPGLQRLTALLTSPMGKERNNFEAGVAVLLQLLCFAPAHIGAIGGMTEEPDVFVAGPDEELLIVECTTDVPDDDKLSKLVSRAARVREKLRGVPVATMPGVVTPVLVTPLPSAELDATRKRAKEHYIMVLCRPNLEEALKRTQFAPDARRVLQFWRQVALG